MTTIINKYIGITHPLSGEGLSDEQYSLILEAWKSTNCPNGIHLWDEVLSIEEHVLFCDACEMEVYISKVEIPDGKEDIVK